MTGDETGPPQGAAGPPAADVALAACPVCRRPMVRGQGNGDDLGPAGQTVWLCNGGPGEDRHPWVWRERVPVESPRAGVRVREVLAAILEAGGLSLPVETEAHLEALIADPRLHSMGVKLPIYAPTGVQRDPEEADGVDEPCDHSNTVFPERPVVDAWYVCPDCGSRVGRRGGEIITIEENNRRAEIIADAGFQAQERMRAVLARRGIRLHDAALDELAQTASPPGVQWDDAERQRAARRVLASLREVGILDDELPIGRVLVACFSAANAVIDFPGTDPLDTSGLESRSTDAPLIDAENMEEPDPRPVHDASLLDRAQAYVELGDLKTIARDKGWHKAFDWIVHHQNEADRVMVDYDPPPLDGDLLRCEKCILQSEQRGVPYADVYNANHDEDGAHVGPDTLPAEAVDHHVHRWEATGQMDTGHSPPRRHYVCICGEEEWTADPRGPEEVTA